MSGFIQLTVQILKLFAGSGKLLWAKKFMDPVADYFSAVQQTDYLIISSVFKQFKQVGLIFLQQKLKNLANSSFITLV